MALEDYEIKSEISERIDVESIRLSVEVTRKADNTLIAKGDCQLNLETNMAHLSTSISNALEFEGDNIDELEFTELLENRYDYLSYEE